MDNLADDVPFAPVAPSALRPFPSPNGQVDMFADIGHAACLSRTGIQPGDVALMTVMDAIAHPMSSAEPIRRDPIMSREKLHKEGGRKE